MSKRDQVQKDALDVAIKNKNCGLGISMGVGKTLIGLQYIKHFSGSTTDKLRVLIVAPKLSIFDSWKSDAEKFNIDVQDVEFCTYLSLYKYDPNRYDIVILDECHSLLVSHIGFLGHYTGRVLGLTGTPPRDIRSEKGQMVSKFCPIRFVYITDDAIDDDILNDYRIFVHMMSLNHDNSMKINLKNKSFYTSEKKNYSYWTSRVNDSNSPKERQITSVMRMRALMEYRTKEIYTEKLLSEIEHKCIVFANTQDQADRLCKYSCHSNNPDSEFNLEQFKLGKILSLSCVLQLNEGVNIPDLKAGIIMHAYGNERKSNQRIGRLLRLNPDDMSIIHILCYKNTVDETWVIGALKDLDQSKITYLDVDHGTPRKI